MFKEMQVYGPTQPKGLAIMKQKDLTLHELTDAIYIFQSNHYKLEVYLGIDEAGFYGSQNEDWENADFITFIPWVQIYEMLGKAERGTTGEFMEGGAKFN